MILNRLNFELLLNYITSQCTLQIWISILMPLNRKFQKIIAVFWSLFKFQSIKHDSRVLFGEQENWDAPFQSLKQERLHCVTKHILNVKGNSSNFIISLKIVDISFGNLGQSCRCRNSSEFQYWKYRPRWRWRTLLSLWNRCHRKGKQIRWTWKFRKSKWSGFPLQVIDNRFS